MSKQYKSFIVFLYLVGGFFFITLPIIDISYLMLTIPSVVAIFVFDMFLKNKWGLFHYLAILIVSTIVSPLINIPGVPWTFKLDDFWLFFGAVVFLIKLVFSKGVKFKVPSFAKLFIIFIIWITATILISVYREPELYSFRDWTELYKNGKLLIILLLAVNVKLNKDKFAKLINVTLYALLGSAVFGIFQYFNILGVNQWLTPHYIFETNYYSLVINRRVVGTFANPNMFAAALLIGIALSFGKMLYKFKMKDLMTLIVFFVVLTLSLSRTSIVLSIVLVGLILFSVFVNSNKKTPALMTVFISPIVVAVVLKLAPSSFYSRLGEFQNLETTGSFTVRMANWENIFHNRTMNNLITGTGPTSGMPITFDNEWLMLLTHYGIIGVLLFLAVFLTIFYKLGRTTSHGFHNIAMRSLMVVFSVYMIFLPVFKVLQLMPIIIILMGLALNQSKEWLEETRLENSATAKSKRRKSYKIVW